MKILIGTKKVAGKTSTDLVNKKTYLVFDDVFENEKSLISKLSFGKIETYHNKNSLAELSHFDDIFLKNFYKLDCDFEKLENYLKEEEGFVEINKKILSWKFFDFMQTLYNLKDYINTLEFKGSNVSRERFLLKVYNEDELHNEIKRQYIKLIKLIQIELKEFFNIDYIVTVKKKII